MTDRSYSLLVLELSDVVKRRDPAKPNLYITLTVAPARERFEQLSRGKGPSWLVGNVQQLREDLSSSDFTTEYSDAKKHESSTIAQLRAEGYTVNRNTDLWTVYVIELDASSIENSGLGYVYVGETSKSPQQRFEEHIRMASNGRTRLFSSVVARHGLRLRMDLAPGITLFDRRASKQAEADWANFLRVIGYKVAGGH